MCGKDSQVVAVRGNNKLFDVICYCGFDNLWRVS